MQTYELLNAMVPTRQEKRRIGEARGYAGKHPEDTIYKECEDPDGSGRPNPLDELLLYVNHALVHHPDAALTTAQFLMHHVEGSLAAAARTLPLSQLILRYQPTGEKESMEAARALSAALRQMVLGGAADGPALLREVEEAERELSKVAVMLRASMQTDVRAGGAPE